MSALSKIPERPTMPIGNRSLDEWAAHYAVPLSDFYMAHYGHRANAAEWNLYTARQFEYQIELDAIEVELTP